MFNGKIMLAVWPRKREIINDEAMNPLQDEIGLCRACRHARVISNARGSKFYRCRLAESDPRFPKYPRLPVRACEGYETATETKPSKGEPFNAME